MIDFPGDIFTEPADVGSRHPGQSRGRCAAWPACGRSDKGVDLNPKAEGPERRVFMSVSEMEPIDPQANGPQLLYGLRYHIHIVAAEEDITFHDQVGYWLWEPATGLIMQSLAHPARAGGAGARGKATPEG